MLSGFVVCEEDVEELTAAWFEDYKQQLEKEEKARMERIRGLWQHLAKRLLMKRRLEEEHVRLTAGTEQSSTAKSKSKPGKKKAKEQREEKTEEPGTPAGPHVHNFRIAEEDEEAGTVTRRCACGFSVTSETL